MVNTSCVISTVMIIDEYILSFHCLAKYICFVQWFFVIVNEFLQLL